MCRNRPLELKGQRGYKVLLLNEVDRLSREAQHSLRRTMEKYSATCRLVFSCSNVSKVSPFPQMSIETSTNSWFQLFMFLSQSLLRLVCSYPCASGRQILMCWNWGCCR